MAGKLAHAIIKNVEYIDVKKGSVLLKVYKEEIEGFSWRQFQELIGKEFGSGKYSYIYKKKNNTTIYKGQINGVSMNKKSAEIIKPDNSGLTFVKESVDKLNERLDAFKGNDLGVDVILQVTRQNYDMQIVFLNREIDKQATLIIKLESKIDELEIELSEADDGGETKILQYFKMAQEFIALKTGGGSLSPVTNLEESSQSDIPPEILSLLGMVDWLQVEPQVTTTIIETLSYYIQKLPMKGK